ncbi:MAG TPA: hypothetical protein VGB18_07770 [Candidatus Thermoplasmatota archaeon]
MIRAVVGSLVFTLIAGCTSDGEFDFGGTFTGEAGQSDLADFRARMEARGADDVLVMESFPMQFRVTGLGSDCDAAADEADSLPYVASVTPCRETTKTSNGDEPTATTQSS